MLFTFAPRKTGKVHWEIGREIEKKGRKKSFKNFLNFSCEKQKEVLVLHPLWETSERQKKHVRRHIELTAVPMQIGTTK